MLIPRFPDFPIVADFPLSNLFRNRNIASYSEAIDFIKELPYGRNTDKNNLSCVFSDGCGTCGTKHAVLKQLADEHSFSEITLFTGIYQMNALNSRRVAHVLEKYELTYLPEAHNYLKYQDAIYDFTFPGQQQLDFIPSLIVEAEIIPCQIADYKVQYHRTFLSAWLQQNAHIKYELDELWKIREECIMALSV